MLDLAVIIVSWNVRDYLADCLRSVYAELERSGLRAEVWVVDNASTDGTQALLADLFPRTHVLANADNPGFGAANNQGMWAAASQNGYGPRYYLLLNPDTLVRPGAIATLVEALEHNPTAGMAGARLVHRDGRFQHSAFAFPGLRQLLFDLFPLPGRLYESKWNGRYARSRFRDQQEPFEIDHPLGAAMLVRGDVAEATGGFDKTFHMYCEEIDWAWRIRRAGWCVLSVPSAEIVHYGGQSTRQMPAGMTLNLWRSRALLYRRHYGRLRFGLARRIALRGLRRKARRAADPALREAYLEAASAWRGEPA
ncbi:MAG: glycosyltransferase family 2 protein [Candidatus Promineifilaceae bacterium]